MPFETPDYFVFPQASYIMVTAPKRQIYAAPNPADKPMLVMPCMPCMEGKLACFWRLDGPCVNCTKLSPKEKTSQDESAESQYCEVIHCVPYDGKGAYALDAVDEADALLEGAVLEASKAYTDMFGHRIGGGHDFFSALRPRVVEMLAMLSERIAKEECISEVKCATEQHTDKGSFYNATPIIFTDRVEIDHSRSKAAGQAKKRKRDEMEELCAGEESVKRIGGSIPSAAK